MNETSPCGPRARALAAIVAAAAVPALSGQAGHAPPLRAHTAPTAYVADTNSKPGIVTPISTITNKSGTPIKTGPAPTTMVITPDGKTAYVANIDNFGLGKVAPVSTATNTAGKPIKVGPGPVAIVITP